MGLDESVPLAGVDTGTARFNPNVHQTTRRSDPATGLQDGPRRHRPSHEPQSEANYGLMGRAARRRHRPPCLSTPPPPSGVLFIAPSMSDKYPPRTASGARLWHTRIPVHYFAATTPPTLGDPEPLQPSLP